MTIDRRDDDRPEAASRSRHAKRPPTASEQLEELLGYPMSEHDNQTGRPRGPGHPIARGEPVYIQTPPQSFEPLPPIDNERVIRGPGHAIQKGPPIMPGIPEPTRYD